MGRQEVEVRVTARADADTVYGLLADGAGWPMWAVFDSFELEQPSAAGGEGLGSIRIFRSHRYGRNYASHERIVELTPGRRLSYELTGGLPLRDYRADVDLSPVDAGTEIRWRATFRATVPGTGWMYRRALTDVFRKCARGLAAQAAMSARSG